MSRQLCRPAKGTLAPLDGLKDAATALLQQSVNVIFSAGHADKW